MPPLVSVCVPSYNYGRFLPDCIESVLQQDLPDLELVLTDDGSTDETVRLVRLYAEADKRVRFIQNPVRLGMNGNLKRAADLSQGRYLKILCADDWLVPSALSRLVALMEAHPTAVLATSAVIDAREDGKALGIQFTYGRKPSRRVDLIAGQKMLSRMARGEGFGGNSSFFIRADAYRWVGGYDSSRPYAGDYDLAARLCGRGDYLHTDEPLFYGRLHGSSSSANDPKALLDVEDWFDVPKKVFAPRVFPSRAWLRYQTLTGLLTARYTLNAATALARGRARYARALFKMVWGRGVFVTGAPLLPLYFATRAAKRLLRLHRTRAHPPEEWMGPPSRRVVPGGTHLSTTS